MRGFVFNLFALATSVMFAAMLFIGFSKTPETQYAGSQEPSGGQLLPWVVNPHAFGGEPRGYYQFSPPQYCPPRYYYYGPRHWNYYPPSQADGDFWRGSILAPEEHREEQYRNWLKMSVRIRNGGVFGSGTICYYDPQKKTAWIISCGHLFRGGEKTCEIHVFYKNDKKLDTVQKYTANILCWTPPIDGGGDDISFLSFQPDWDIDAYAPIAQQDLPIQPGATYYSCGCDGAREVACYLMKAKGMEGRNLVLVENGPRHGRSGGGLMTADGWYVGICWGSTDPYNGTGKGLFVPLPKIHAFARAHDLGWLLEVGMFQQYPARRLPIINWNSPQKQFSPDYVPIP